MVRSHARDGLGALAICLLFIGGSAVGQTGAPCDSSVKQGTCNASADIVGKRIILKSSTKQCSIIAWTVDGSSRITTVIDGEEPIEFLSSAPKIGIDSCTVVRDLRTGQSASQGQRPDAVQTSSLSPWHGTWLGVDKNVYGSRSSHKVIINAKDDRITGSWFDGGSETPFTGQLNGSKLKLNFSGAPAITLTLVDRDTLKYRWFFSSGTFKRDVGAEVRPPS